MEVLLFCFAGRLTYTPGGYRIKTTEYTPGGYLD